jgi:ssDNA-binding Zn-finger/Zn-ribbon topoisomerase 1
MAVSPLKVPFAYDAVVGIIWPEHAAKGIDYFCPNCREKLVLRAGEIKRCHFAHRPNGVCNQETILHKSAKLLVQSVVRDWKNGKALVPEVLRQCRICQESSPQPLPEKVTDAQLEYRLTDGLVLDVALLAGQEVVAAVEILVTHEVSEEKSDRLSVRSIRFVEIEASAVLASPRLWKPVNGSFKAYTCPKCHDRLARFIKKTREVADRCEIALPVSYYRYGLYPCYKCNQMILAFDWPGRALWPEARPQQQPVPGSVQYRFVKKKYWVNTCPLCHATQGDWHVFMEPGGPFMDADLSYMVEVIGEEAAKVWRDSPEAFREDMLKLAFLADYNGYLA